ncbi:MAG: prolipoprotein diacylglyceryl transferase family protein [Chloroflexota bacterium]
MELVSGQGMSPPGGNLYPILFQIGTWDVRSYFLFLSLGAVVGGMVGWKEAKRIGFSSREISVFFAIIFPVALLLGLVNGWVFNPDFYYGLARGRLVLYGGLVSYGIIFGALLVDVIYNRVRKLPVGVSLDLIVLVLPLMLAFTRVGCLFNGCCYGLETHGFFSMFLPDEFGFWVDRYPTQLMLIALNTGLFIWLWIRRKNKVFDGSQVLPFLFWYAAGRLVIDSLRDLPPVALGLGFHQWTAILILVSISLIYVQRWIAGQVKHKM